VSVSFRQSNNWRVPTAKTPSNTELVLVMSDGTRETWTRAPADRRAVRFGAGLSVFSRLLGDEGYDRNRRERIIL